MNTTIFLIKRAIRRVTPGREQLTSVVVRAYGPKQARDIAAENSGGEGVDVWYDRSKAKLSMIGQSVDVGCELLSASIV